MDDIALSLTDGCTITVNADQMIVNSPLIFYWPAAGMRFMSPGLKAAFHRLEGQRATVAELRQIVEPLDGPAGLAHLERWLARLSQRALLAHTLLQDGKPLATLQPISPYFEYREGAAAPDRSYRLSRFALLRRDGDDFVVETPQGYAYLRLHAPVIQAAVSAFARPHTGAGLAAAAGLSASTATRLLDFLVCAGAVVPADTPEENDPVLGLWAFHDLLFHTRSRLGRHGVPGGGLYAAASRSDAPPVVKPPMSDEVIALARPDLFALKERDVPFTKVLEERASARRQGKSPPTVAQLGEFLYRTARVKRMVVDAGVSFRPYAGCAGLYPLEIYPLVTRCEGLEPGLYHYAPQDHRLYRLGAPAEPIQRLAHLAGATALLDGTPQILFLIAARVQRVQARYRSTAYASILQDLGSLYQTMYLVARAMGLAPVALGGGFPDLFARATGLDPLRETSVGEFVLCSPYDGPDARTVPAEAVVGEPSRGGFGIGVVIKGEGS